MRTQRSRSIRISSSATTAIVEGQSLTLTAVANAQGGTATLGVDGFVTFTPAANFNGDATFKYTVSDGALTTTALCTVTVAPVNDKPVARPDSTTGVKNTVKVINVATLLANDTDVDMDTLTVIAPLGTFVGGTAVFANNNTTIRFTPTANVTTGSFVYTVSDGNLTNTAKVTITFN